MADFPEVPSECEALLTRLAKRKNALVVKEECPTFGWIYVFNDDAREKFAWSFLETLSERGFLAMSRRQPYGRPESVSLCLTEEGRKEFETYSGATAAKAKLREWQTCLEKLDLSLVSDVSVLNEPLASISGVSDVELLQAHLHCLKHLETSGIEYTLRFLSANFFWGLSKYLESLNKTYSDGIYGSRLDQLAPRNLLVNVRLADVSSPLLFVENMDTFLLLSELNAPYHLIYSQGFMASSSRIRNCESVVFSYTVTESKHIIEDFERRWIELEKVEAYFWGDLDFSGLQIYISLSKVFVGIEVWRPAYDLMVGALSKGHHWDAKYKQTEPEPSGIEIVDSYLAPSIRNAGRFLDQEWVSKELLLEIFKGKS